MLGGLEPLTDTNALAIRVWNALANGMGGLDWSGLDFHCQLLGVQDVEALVDALLDIKTHRPRKLGEMSDQPPDQPPDPETL